MESVTQLWSSFPMIGKTIIVTLLLGLIYSVIKKLVKIAFMITILLVLVFVIRSLWGQVSSPW